MKYALYLGRIFGVKIYVHWTFVFLIGWIILVGLRNSLPLAAFLWTFGLTLAVFACIVLHELSHAIVARRFGISTRYITLLPIGGIAQFESMPKKAKEELLIALAGPAANIILAAVLFPFVNIHELAQQGSLMTINTANFVFSTSANFGNMFSVAGTSLFLPFLPLLPKQILLLNFLTDLPAMAIASDRVDSEQLSKPKKWDSNLIRKFMIVFGIESSLFDFLTFGFLLWFFHSSSSLNDAGLRSDFCLFPGDRWL